jgi:hypothetical protein
VPEPSLKSLLAICLGIGAVLRLRSAWPRRVS